MQRYSWRWRTSKAGGSPLTALLSTVARACLFSLQTSYYIGRTRSELFAVSDGLFRSSDVALSFRSRAGLLHNRGVLIVSFLLCKTESFSSHNVTSKFRMISADHMDFRWLIFLGLSLCLELRVVLVSEALCCTGLFCSFRITTLFCERFTWLNVNHIYCSIWGQILHRTLLILWPVQISTWIFFIYVWSYIM